MVAMSKLVPEFSRRFEVELANPKEELKDDNQWYRTMFRAVRGMLILGLLSRNMFGSR
jgi:hypothetical protein